MRPHLRPSPKTDSQQRLRYIQEVCGKIEDDRGPLDIEASIRKLAYAINYLAMIVEKHLATDEK